MIRNLTTLKYTKTGFAVLFAVFLFIFLYRLFDLFLAKINFKQKGIDAFEDIPTIWEMNRMAGAVKEYKNELNRRTWFYTAGAGLFGFLMLSGAAFYTSVVKTIGIELFAGLCLLFLVLMLLCILRKANYKENACLYLGEYIYTLCHIYPDFHECIRLLLSPQYTNVVFGDVIAAIYRSVQEISDVDMLLAAGRIMHSEMLIDTAEKIKQKMNGGRFLSAYYTDSFTEVKGSKKSSEIQTMKKANIIGFSISFLCLFCLCLTLSIASA